MRARGDGGETLIEVLLTIVIVSLTFTALFTSLATAGNAGNAQRVSVQGDVVMRNYAEAVKAAAQKCVPGVRLTVGSTPTYGSLFKVAGTDRKNCPPVLGTLTLTLAVTGPLGFHDTMTIKVRTP